jgi:hypothetical protein
MKISQNSPKKTQKSLEPREGSRRNHECFHTTVTPGFSKENPMHLICVPGSDFHTYDGQMSVILQEIAQIV